MKKNLKLAAVAVAILVLSACGGGGGDETPVAPATPATTEFPLGQAYRNTVQSSRSQDHEMSGTCSGSANLVTAAPVASTFESQPALLKSYTWTFSSTQPGCPNASVTGQDFHQSGTLSMLGTIIPGTSYTKADTPVLVPERVKAGDTAVLGTATSWTNSSKTTRIGTSVYSYVVDPESANNVVVRLIVRQNNTAGAMVLNETVSYRLSSTGALTKLRDEATYASGSTLVLTPR